VVERISPLIKKGMKNINAKSFYSAKNFQINDE